jgi:hypothetical protein
MSSIPVLNEGADTSHWVRRSGRPHKAVKYFEDTYADLMEDGPENTVQATTVTLQATGEDASEDSATLEVTSEVMVATKSNTNSPSPAPSSASVSRVSTPNTSYPMADDTPHLSSNDYEAAIAEEHAMQEAAHILLQLFHSDSATFTAEVGDGAARNSLSLLTTPPADQPRSEESSALSLDFTKDVAPSATNKYQFTSVGSTGRTAARLNALFRPPPRMPRWPLDVASGHTIKLSYTQLGPRPSEGLSDDLAEQMEKQHALYVERVEDEMEDLIETEDEDGV